MYHLFAGYDYSQGGGMYEYRGGFDSVEDAQARFTEGGWDWGQIVDSGLGLRIILEYGENEPYGEWQEPQDD